MSKRKSFGSETPKYTIFKYFAKSPATEKKKIPMALDNSAVDEDSSCNGAGLNNSVRAESEKSFIVPTSENKKLKHSLTDEDYEKSVEDVQKKKESPNNKQKRRRILVHDSSDDENATMPNENSDSDEKNIKDKSFNAEHKNDDNDTDDDEPKKKKVKRETADGSRLLEKLHTLQQMSQGDTKLKSKGDNAKYEKIVHSNSTLDEPVVWPHNKLEFMKPSNIKDKHGRRPDNPDYDATTLYVPKTFLDSLSPAVRQWWIMKSENFDCVLFFKIGKFYELYNMDADVGVSELGFTYMRGEFAHAGFPEVSFDKMASTLVDRGYKVARVEQTETPDMMAERCKLTKPTKFDKVVSREICQITNRGTQVFGSQCQITANHEPNYMLAIMEQNKGIISRYGICFIDTSIGDFFIGEFDDDKSCSRLLTLLSHHMPVLVLTEKHSISVRTQQLFRTHLSGVLQECLPSAGAAQQCSAERTLKHFAEMYFAASSSKNDWPQVIRQMQSESDHLGLTPNDDCKLALKALGACVAYLQKCHLEEKVMPMARYHLYVPPDLYDEGTKNGTPEIPLKGGMAHANMRSHMVLDAITLSNLRIIGEEHSLLHTLDSCCTKFGKRLLHHWLCAPSCNLAVLTERQTAITDLIEHTNVLQEARALLAPMPDFERHLAQIHMFGNKLIMQQHPDGRAIMFEEKQYNRRKIQNFITILTGFETLMRIPKIFGSCESTLIKRLSQLAKDDGIFPDMSELLEFFKNAFNHEEAAKSGVIAPEKGIDADYDNIEARIAAINDDLHEYLILQEKHFGCRVVYFGTDKKRYQLEVPESAVRKAGKEYALEGQKKGSKPVRRYSTPETKNFLKQMQEAEEERNCILKDLSRRIFEKFSKHYNTWKQCIDCVATLDVLGSLAEYARAQPTICVPELSAAIGAKAQQGEPFIDIDEGYHPCVPADTYIPNGIVLGAAGTAPLSILTGPNMGGKSTLMREVGLLVIMAQIGSHVPAQHCRLSLVDRIFTRLGAQDDILAGQSTFLVELNETSLILKHSTRNSLVLLDELGRGTATYDGTAIAASVVNYLADLKCRTLFSTHYHNLIDFFDADTRITLGHMACMVENEENAHPTQETVTFLYKYTAGACPKSYGFNAAKLAGMPEPIIKRAYELSKRVEAIALKRKIVATMLTVVAGKASATNQLTTMKTLLQQLKSCLVY